ncbi:MAG: type II and III secretion system protein family protein [Aureliella sp.]
MQGTARAQSAFPQAGGGVGSGVRLVSADNHQKVRMVINTSRELSTDMPFQRVRIQNPNILSVIPLEGGNRLQISALQAGVTQLDLLTGDDSVHTVEVMVIGDARELEAILRDHFPSANLSVTPVQQGCIVSGVVTSDEHVEQVIAIAELYFPTVIDQVNVLGVHTVQLETQIMEVSRTKLRELGIDWGVINGDDFVTQSVSGLIAPASTAAGLATSGGETFKVGVVQNSTTFLGVVRALRQNNLVKVLANPTITAVDGRPASFNAGGEIPIVVPAGLGQVAIQYREYGTRVDMVAKVRGEGRIWLEVRPYVSEIDPTRSVTLQGISVPGLRSRFLETGVELQAGQTLALGGLLQMRTESINTGLPFFGDLPYLGTFFRSNRELQNEVELLITVTPNFAGPLDPCEVPAGGPGLNTTSPTDKELYWKGYLEVPVGATGANCVPGQAGVGPYLTGPGAPTTAPLLESPAEARATPAVSVGPNAPKLAQPVDPNAQSGNTAGRQFAAPLVR